MADTNRYRRRLMPEKTKVFSDDEVFPLTIDNESDGNGGYIQYDRKYMASYCGVDIIDVFNKAKDKKKLGDRVTEKLCSFGIIPIEEVTIKFRPDGKGECLYKIYENGEFVKTISSSENYKFSYGTYGRCIVCYTSSKTYTLQSANGARFSSRYLAWTFLGFSGDIGCNINVDGYNTSLKQIHYTNNFNFIGIYSFESSKLKGTLIVPRTINRVEWDFQYPSGIRKIKLCTKFFGSGAHSISRDNFYALGTPVEIVGEANEKYHIYDDVLYYRESEAKLYAITTVVSQKTNLIIEDGCTEILNQAVCTSYSNITGTITVPNTVTKIGDFKNFAFTGTIDFSNLSLNQGLDMYPEQISATYRRNLNQVLIPEGITSFGTGFLRYTAIRSFTIPSTVTSIGNYSFAHLENVSHFDLYCKWIVPITYNETWLISDYSGHYHSATIHVPIGCIQNYIDKGWNQTEFTIVEDVII